MNHRNPKAMTLNTTQELKGLRKANKAIATERDSLRSLLNESKDKITYLEGELKTRKNLPQENEELHGYIRKMNTNNFK